MGFYVTAHGLYRQHDDGGSGGAHHKSPGDKTPAVPAGTPTTGGSGGAHHKSSHDGKAPAAPTTTSTPLPDLPQQHYKPAPLMGGGSTGRDIEPPPPADPADRQESGDSDNS